MLLEHLEIADRHVEEGTEHVERHRELIAELGEQGRDTAEAIRLLDQFQELLSVHIADRNRLQGMLAQLSD